MTLLTDLSSILEDKCFKFNLIDSSISIEQTQNLDDNGERVENPWVQCLKVNNLSGDELFFSFDMDDHKRYSNYLISDKESFIAKACDYIMIKKEGDKYTICLGELKLGTKSFSAESVNDQINGSIAFLKYIFTIVKIKYGYDIDTEYKKFVFYKLPLTKGKTRKVGTTQKNRISRIRDIKTESFPMPHNDIIRVGLPFSRLHNIQEVTLQQFLGRA